MQVNLDKWHHCTVDKQEFVKLLQKSDYQGFKHILIFFENDIGDKIKGICFNSNKTILGDYLEKHNQYKFYFSCTVTIDKFASEPLPQIIIRDIMKID